MSAEAAYTPCQCPACRQRPVYGVCRCRFCNGDCPEDVRASMVAVDKDRAVALLQLEDTRPLTEREARELEAILARMTRSL